MQKDETFCTIMLKLIDEKKVSPERYFINDEQFLHRIVKENDKISHALVVP